MFSKHILMFSSIKSLDTSESKIVILFVHNWGLSVPVNSLKLVITHTYQLKNFSPLSASSAFVSLTLFHRFLITVYLKRTLEESNTIPMATIKCWLPFIQSSPYSPTMTLIIHHTLDKSSNKMYLSCSKIE
jgi:hypothetical protein